MFYESINKGKEAKVSDDDTDIIDYLMSCDGNLFLLDPDKKNRKKVNYPAFFEIYLQNFNREKPFVEEELLLT